MIARATRTAMPAKAQRSAQRPAQRRMQTCAKVGLFYSTVRRGPAPPPARPGRGPGDEIPTWRACAPNIITYYTTILARMRAYEV